MLRPVLIKLKSKLYVSCGQDKVQQLLLLLLLLLLLVAVDQYG